MASKHKQRRTHIWMQRAAEHQGFDDVGDFVEYYAADEGFTEHDFASTFECSRWLICRIFKEHGYDASYKRGRGIHLSAKAEAKEAELVDMETREVTKLTNSQIKVLQIQQETAAKSAERYNDEFTPKKNQPGVEVNMNMSFPDLHFDALKALGRPQEAEPARLEPAQTEQEKETIVDADYEIEETT